MKDDRSLKSLHLFLTAAAYFYLLLDFAIFIFWYFPPFLKLHAVLNGFLRLPFFRSVLSIKLTGFCMLALASVGTQAKKDKDLSWARYVAYPLAAGLTLYAGSYFFFTLPEAPFTVTAKNIAYMSATIGGAILISISLDNISKKISASLGKDFWNIENETWMQETAKIENEYSVNIRTKFYCKKRHYFGWINVVNIFRGNLVLGIPGSGKSVSVIIPFIRQLMAKEFSMLVYDYKFPDLYNISYAHYLQHKKKGKFKNFRFAILDVNNVQHSVRVNPLSTKYLTTLAECAETAEALLQALRKGGQSGGGSDQFFTQSAVNFLACVFYFLLKTENGAYCSLPHAIAFLNKDYDTQFACFDSVPELKTLLSPFYNAYKNKSFDQLEGQIGTLKINIGRIASKESFWVFSKDEFDLDINNPASPAILVLSNNPATMNINGAFYSVVLNRITPLMNKKNNVPSLIAVDELPTLYFHKLEHLLATGRSNRIAIVLGVQDLPQLKLNWNTQTSEALVSIIGNVFCGIVRDKNTLDWMEKLFGKVRQLSDSVNIDANRTSVNLSDRLDNLVQGSKISSLKTGEMIGVTAQDFSGSNKFTPSFFSAKLLLDEEAEAFEKNAKITPKELVHFPSVKDKEELLMANFHKIYGEIDNICLKFTGR
jgi:hypothetical protein